MRVPIGSRTALAPFAGALITVSEENMLGTTLKLIAYSKAPRTTFAMRHPVKAVRIRKMQWDMRHAYAPRLAAVGAAAFALPLGLWLGRGRGRVETQG